MARNLRNPPQNGQNVYGFQVTTPICHIVPSSRAYGYEVKFPQNCNPPGLLQESLGPFGPEVSLGVSLGPFGPRGSELSKKCPQSARECPGVSGHLFDTPGPLRRLRSPGPKGPQRHPEGHSRDTSARRARELLSQRTLPVLKTLRRAISVVFYYCHSFLLSVAICCLISLYK